MKKSYNLFAVVLAFMSLVGCSDDLGIETEVNKGQEVAATSELLVTGTINKDAETRVSFADGGTSITPSWEVGDQVFGFYGENTLTYEVASVADGVASFTLVNGTEPTDGATVHMIYAPGKSVSDLSSQQLAIDLGQQDGTLSGLKNHAIMCATATVSGSALSLQFENQVAIVGVKQFTGLKANTTYTSATFTSAGPTATVKVEGGVLKLVTDDAYGTITATGSFASDASGNTTSTIYFAVPPTDAVEHQFTLVCDNDYRIGAISAKAVEAGKYLFMTTKALRECVDLGLPSHTLWAATNVGASSPEGFGDYYAWGEVETQASGRYWWDSYKWGNASSSNSGLTKYNSTDGLTRLLPEDDAATVNWKNSWRIPTKDEFDELINTTYTTLDWTTQNGVSGMKITSKVNGKSIFLPAAGLKDYSNENRDPGACNYPTSDLMTNEMSHCHNYKYNSNRQNSNYGRCGGRPVRAVIAPMATYNNSANATTGTAPVLESAGCPNNECGWVQLWAGGPRWAEFNVGASATTYAGMTEYSFENIGGKYSFHGRRNLYDDVDGATSGDTATDLWGTNWRTPTYDELGALFTNCDLSYCDGSIVQYVTGCTLKGWKISGKGEYAGNSIFMPLAGVSDQNAGSGVPYYYNESQRPGNNGWYWSCTPGTGNNGGHIYFGTDRYEVNFHNKPHGDSVRAVLKEQ